MDAEKYYEDKWENSELLDWIGVDPRSMRDIIYHAFRAGAEAKYQEIVNDREFMEHCLRDMDHEDELQSQEILRRGEF